MIGRLKGLVVHKQPPWLVVDVHGVGYLVGASARTLAAIGPVGDGATLFTEMLVAEEFIRLVGFASAAERDWFRLLTGVQGVGARVALAILSALEPADISRAVMAQDKATVARANGVGPKLAARIVAELKDKAPAFGHVDPALIRLSDALDDRNAPAPVADAVSALVNLGYPQIQASAAVAAALKQAGDEAEAKTLIRLGLRELAR